jgi:hypothetical protein
MSAYLHNLKMQDKYCRNLTAFEIATAFPDERILARQLMDELVKEVDFYKDIISKEPLTVHFMSIDPRIKRINEIQRYLNMTSPIKANATLNVELAKQYPIRDLYDFGDSKYKVKCPFHDDRKPSAVINKNNTFHCYVCNIHLDSIAFIQKLQGLNFVQAVKKIGGMNEL